MNLIKIKLAICLSLCVIIANVYGQTTVFTDSSNLVQTDDNRNWYLVPNGNDLRTSFEVECVIPISNDTGGYSLSNTTEKEIWRFTLAIKEPVPNKFVFDNSYTLFSLILQGRNIKLKRAIKSTGLNSQSSLQLTYPLWQEAIMPADVTSGSYTLRLQMDEWMVKFYVYKANTPSDEDRQCELSYWGLNNTYLSSDSLMLAGDNNYGNITDVKDELFFGISKKVNSFKVNKDVSIEASSPTDPTQVTNLVSPNGDCMCDDLPVSRDLLSESDADFTIYPNPTTGELNLRLAHSTESTASINILDISGRLLYTRKMPLVKGAQELNLGNLKAAGLSSGIYFLQVSTPDLNQTTKIVIQ